MLHFPRLCAILVDTLLLHNGIHRQERVVVVLDLVHLAVETLRRAAGRRFGRLLLRRRLLRRSRSRSLDLGLGHALWNLSPGRRSFTESGARRVHRAALILARRLAVLATRSVDGIHHCDKLLLVGANLKLDLTLAKRVKRKVLTRTDTIAGVELRLMRKR